MCECLVVPVGILIPLCLPVLLNYELAHNMELLFPKVLSFTSNIFEADSGLFSGLQMGKGVKPMTKS